MHINCNRRNINHFIKIVVYCNVAFDRFIPNPNELVVFIKGICILFYMGFGNHNLFFSHNHKFAWIFFLVTNMND